MDDLGMMEYDFSTACGVCVGDVMTEQTPDSSMGEDAAVAARREALIKMGKFVGYSAPALLVLLTATKAQAASPPHPE